MKILKGNQSHTSPNVLSLCVKLDEGDLKIGTTVSLSQQLHNKGLAMYNVGKHTYHKKIYSPLNSSQMKQTMYSVLDKHTDFHHFRLFPFPGLVCNAKTTKSAKSEEKSTLFQTLLHSKDTLCSRHLIQNGDMDRELSPSHQAAFQWCLG